MLGLRRRLHSGLPEQDTPALIGGVFAFTETLQDAIPEQAQALVLPSDLLPDPGILGSKSQSRACVMASISASDKRPPTGPKDQVVIARQLAGGAEASVWHFWS
jgi:hypothetical protein